MVPKPCALPAYTLKGSQHLGNQRRHKNEKEVNTLNPKPKCQWSEPGSFLEGERLVLQGDARNLAFGAFGGAACFEASHVVFLISVWGFGVRELGFWGSEMKCPKWWDDMLFVVMAISRVGMLVCCSVV